MKKISLLIIIFIFCSCSSKRKIIYLQKSDINKEYNINYIEHKLQIDNILKIDVSSEQPETSLLFNTKNINNASINNKDALEFDGYQINSKGYIYFPVIGEIYVKDKTIREVREYIRNEIIDKKILKNPTVDVKLINGYFTALGEVNKPGKHEFVENNLNILEAIGIAGDLTINGTRNDIRIIREIDQKNKVYSIDLTKSSLIESNNYQIFSGDIIIVNPNPTKVKNAGIIGNSGTLLSLLSFILSSIIVISNNN